LNLGHGHTLDTSEDLKPLESIHVRIFHKLQFLHPCPLTSNSTVMRKGYMWLWNI
jgi:hypothetical protein